MSTLKTRILISTCESGHFTSFSMLVHFHLDPRGGVEITQAEERKDCERLATSGDFDLIVLFGQTTLYSRGFIGSPLDNSIAIIKAIKAKVATPVLALSSVPDEEHELLSAGADTFVAMPFTFKGCTSAMDRCLNRE